MERKDVSAIELQLDGESIFTTLRKNWLSFAEVEKADADYMTDRVTDLRPENWKDHAV